MQPTTATPTETARPAALVPTGSPLFSLGQLCATPGALEVLEQSGQQPIHFVARHVAGDWSEMDAEDQQTNREALECGARVLSSYTTKNGQKLWIITEADRSVTTLLLPSEY